MEKKENSHYFQNLVFNLIFGVLTLTATVLFYKKIFLLAIILLALGIISLLKWKSKVATRIYIFGAIFGAIAEIIAISFGVWEYQIINLFNIPFWLIFLWGNAALFIYRATINFRRHKK